MDYKAHEKTLEEVDMFIVLIVMMILQVSKLKLYFKYIASGEERGSQKGEIHFHTLGGEGGKKEMGEMQCS